MLEIGYEFERNNRKYCLIDILELNSKYYALFSVERGYDKLSFEFCEITETATDYNFKTVTDVNITNMLFDKLGRSNYGA